MITAARAPQGSFTQEKLVKPSAFQIGWMWLGVSLMAVAFFSLLALLSWANVSLVVPATAASYLVGTLGAQFILGERVDTVRWIGVVIVCIGVALVCAA